MEKKDESLREKIARIMKDKQDRLAISRGDMTVLALVELYISQKSVLNQVHGWDTKRWSIS